MDALVAKAALAAAVTAEIAEAGVACGDRLL